MTAISRRSLLAAAAALLPAQRAFAQAGDFPRKNLTFIVPFAPGGATDIVARVVAPGMQEALGRSVVVDNRGGAAGAIASDMVANAPPDGHTFIIYTITNAVLGPALATNARVDPRRDFRTVSLLATLPMVLTVGNHVPARTLPELIALMKARPGQLTYGSSGIGSLNHFGGHMMTALTGTQALHVPYRGSGPALNDMISGNVDMVIEGIASLVQFIRGNSIRAIATLAPQRSPQLPDVPTAVEQGLADFNIINFMGLFAHAQTPPDIIAKLEQAAGASVRNEATRRRLTEAGTDPSGSTAAEFNTFYQAQLAQWMPLIASSGIKLE